MRKLILIFLIFICSDVYASFPELIAMRTLIDETFITGAPRKTLDISTYLSHPNSKIVIIEVKNVTGGVIAVGILPVGGTVFHQKNITAGESMTYAVQLNSSNEIAYQTNSASMELYLRSEWGGPHVHTYSDWTETGGTLDAWADIDITADVGSDAGNVEAIICQFNHIGDATPLAGIRENGGTEVFRNPSGWGIAKVDDSDIFEAFRDEDEAKNPGPNGRVYKVGWITRDSNFRAEVNVVAVTSVKDAWTERDFGKNRIAVVARQFSFLGTFLLDIRSTKESFDPMRVQISQRTALAAEVIDGVYEYYEQSGFAAIQYIEGYLSGPNMLQIRGTEMQIKGTEVRLQ